MTKREARFESAELSLKMAAVMCGKRPTIESICDLVKAASEFAAAANALRARRTK
jgi:hypothetical protein